jgi:hypothetical protein
MGIKAVLVELDEDRWKRAKIRAAVMGKTASAFADDALAAYLVATEDVEKVALAETDLHTANYVATLSATDTHTFVNALLNPPEPTDRLRAAAQSSGMFTTVNTKTTTRTVGTPRKKKR